MNTECLGYDFLDIEEQIQEFNGIGKLKDDIQYI